MTGAIHRTRAEQACALLYRDIGRGLATWIPLAVMDKLTPSVMA
jgi:hypothetical protein